MATHIHSGDVRANTANRAIDFTAETACRLWWILRYSEISGEKLAGRNTIRQNMLAGTMETIGVVLLLERPQAGCFARLVEVLKVTIASRTVIKWASSENVGLVPENGRGNRPPLLLRIATSICISIRILKSTKSAGCNDPSGCNVEFSEAFISRQISLSSWIILSTRRTLLLRLDFLSKFNTNRTFRALHTI